MKKQILLILLFFLKLSFKVKKSLLFVINLEENAMKRL